MRNDGSIRAGAVIRPYERDPRCTTRFTGAGTSSNASSGCSASTRRIEHRQQPGAEHAEPGAGLGLPVGEVAGGQVDQVEQRGQLARPPAGTSNGASSSPARGATVASTAPAASPGRPGSGAAARGAARRSRPARRGEPLPVPDQQRVGEDGHVPRRPVAVPGAVPQLGVAGALGRACARRRPARRPSGRSATAASRSAQLRPVRRWSASQPRVMPQQPATSRIAAASRSAVSGARGRHTGSARLDQHLRGRATARRAATRGHGQPARAPRAPAR